MLSKSIVGVALCVLAFTALASGVPRRVHVGPVAGTAPAECDSSGDTCVRVYKKNEDVESQSYKVVRFSELEIVQANKEDLFLVHRKIVNEAGFDCKRAKFEQGVFRCEEGAIITHQDLLIGILVQLYAR